jgi:hypothetical protein
VGFCKRSFPGLYNLLGVGTVSLTFDGDMSLQRRVT